MRVVVATGNQPRHISLVEVVARFASHVSVFSETTAVRSGHVSDFYPADLHVARYFDHVRRAENETFGVIRSMPKDVQVLPIRMRDLQDVGEAFSAAARRADIIIVFGSSLIKRELLAGLGDPPTLNLHAGISPYYRGTGCNFWALYDQKPHLVGVTLHALDEGIDSGPIYLRMRPSPIAVHAPFAYTMSAIRCGIDSLADVVPRVLSGDLQALPQDHGKLVRYSRNRDFTSDIARQFLERLEEWEVSSEAPLIASHALPCCEILPPDF